VWLCANRSAQLGINQVLHSSLHQPVEQISRINITKPRYEVGNSSIIFMGHRVNISLCDHFVAITESHAMAHPKGGPSSPHFHHITGHNREVFGTLDSCSCVLQTIWIAHGTGESVILRRIHPGAG
jgi:hypothetical protein